MPELSVDLDVLRHALFERSLSQVGDSLLEVKVKSPLRVVDLVLQPSAALSVRVLNRPEDKDAYVAVPPGGASAFVKYTLSAKSEGKIALAPAAYGATGDVVLTDYRLHAATDSAWGALTSDLAAPRTLLELADVKKLQRGEALVMELGGALTVAVSFSWSDMLASKLPEIAGATPLTVKLKSGLDTSVAVKVKDRFSVAISRTAEGHYRFAVRKAAAHTNEIGIEAALGLELSAVRGLDEVLDALFQHAPEELAHTRDAVRKKLVTAVTWKASTGLTYEYARIEENSSIAEFVLLDDAQLANDYALVLSGEFAKLTEALRRNDGTRQLVKYLNENTLTSRTAFGFSLALGKWAIKAQESSTLRRTTRTSLDGLQLITCVGTRAYDEKNIPENDFEWTVDLKAQMKEFRAAPTTLDFDYGLHLLLTIERGAIREDDLERMLDLASMWGVCVPDAGAVAEAIGRKGSLRVQLLLEQDALTAALAQNAVLDSRAGPLAMAMPYMSTFTERRAFGARRDVYADAWREWLGSGTTAEIRTNSGLTIFERQKRAGSFAWTAGEGHPRLRQDLEAFLDGARALHRVMTTAQAPEAIGDAYALLQRMWSQRLSVAAAGRWLVERADVRATLQIEYADTTVTS